MDEMKHLRKYAAISSAILLTIVWALLSVHIYVQQTIILGYSHHSFTPFYNHIPVLIILCVLQFILTLVFSSKKHSKFAKTKLVFTNSVLLFVAGFLFLIVTNAYPYCYEPYCNDFSREFSRRINISFIISLVMLGILYLSFINNFKHGGKNKQGKELSARSMALKKIRSYTFFFVLLTTLITMFAPIHYH